jgi:hypothetical protein
LLAALDRAASSGTVALMQKLLNFILAAVAWLFATRRLVLTFQAL